MQHHKLFFSAIVINALAYNSCFAMDKPLLPSKEAETISKVTKIDKGLLTQLSVSLVSINPNGKFLVEYQAGQLRNTPKDSLINLMRKNYATALSDNNKISRYSPAIFFPTIVKIEGEKLTNFGSYDALHKEVKEACRLSTSDFTGSQVLAAYVNYKQGVLVYSLEPLNLGFVQSKIEELKQIADHNYAESSKPLYIALPVTFALSKNY
jgi:hypothetical protein